jgi:hypothetical protein
MGRSERDQVLTPARLVWVSRRCRAAEGSGAKIKGALRNRGLRIAECGIRIADCENGGVIHHRGHGGHGGGGKRKNDNGQICLLRLWCDGLKKLETRHLVSYEKSGSCMLAWES